MRSVLQVIAVSLAAGWLTTVAIPTSAEEYTVSSVQELVLAIENANLSAGPHVVHLEAGVYTFTQPATSGESALPQVVSNITLQAADFNNRPSLERSAGAAAFRLADVGAGGSLSLIAVDVRGFQAPSAGDFQGHGGAFLNREDGRLSLGNIIIEDNSASGDGGAVMSMGSLSVSATMRNNSAGRAGGAVYQSGQFDSFRAVFDSNEAGDIGGSLVLTNSEDIFVRATAFVRSMADTGGGVYMTNTTGDIQNTTLSGNKANTGSGGLLAFDSDVRLLNVTITDNTVTAASRAAAEPTGLGSGGGASSDGSITMSNTILSGNSPNDCGGDLTSSGHNILGATPGCAVSGPQTSDISTDSPGLGPLADNGGFTLTHALTADSPALDSGDNAVCPTQDQRLEPRPADGDGNGSAICDRGALENPQVGQQTILWGDGNCNSALLGEDALYPLAYLGDIEVETNGCPSPGSTVDVSPASIHTWGDWDCSGVIDAADALFILLQLIDLGPPPTGAPGCPTPGVFVDIVPQ
jgi:hypothetical protein